MSLWGVGRRSGPSKQSIFMSHFYRGHPGKISFEPGVLCVFKNEVLKIPGLDYPLAISQAVAC